MSVSNWSIGWLTPLMICGFYIIAITIAGGQIAFYLYLDGRTLEETLPQDMVSTISTAFVYAFRSTLGIALTSAFTQRLWNVFRKRPLKASTIDLLFSALRTPFSTIWPSFPRYAVVEWTFAILFWSLPIATIFPPGSIYIITQPRVYTRLFNVPTYDSEFHPVAIGNSAGLSNYTALLDQALFQMLRDGDYFCPYAEVSTLVKQTIMTGKYLTSVSPCGLNCTYALSFPGPAFKCTTQPGLKSNKDLNFTGCSVPCYQGKENIIEGPEYPKKTTNSMYGPTYDFFASYTVMGNVQNPLRTIKCTTWMADYKVNVTYTQGAQSVDVQLDKKYAINATMHDRYYDFYEEPLLDKATGLQLEVNRFARDTNGRYWEEGDPGIETLFREAQARAIKDSLVQPLLGTVIGIYSEAQKVTDTMILETIFAPSLKSVNVYGAVLTWELSLTPERLEELMINATLSVMTLGNWTTPADTIVTEWVGFYSFKNQKMIYIPYAVTLGVSLFYIILGLLALVDNGVAAEDVGFLQVACTTTGNVAFDEAAASGCLGGPSNTSGNSRLADMYLLYGDLGASQSYKGDGMVKRAGFGPPEQVRPLEKGGRYGCAMGSSESEPFLR